MENWLKAGKLTAEVIEYGKNLIKVGSHPFDVINKIENKISELKAKPAFPPQISINEFAAHCIPDKEIKFKENDLVKLDIGVCVDGAIGDSAVSIDLGNNKDLIKASEAALNESIKIIRIGTKLSEIGSIIEKTIIGFGFKPIKNLSGHEIKEYQEHAGLTIPNFDNNDKTKLTKGQIIAIEPFATSGSGYIQDGKESGIYKLLDIKQVRNQMTRDILKFIVENYKTLPFSKHWLIKKFGPFKTSFALKVLERENVLHHYKQLVERNKEKVSQAEHTLLIDDEVKILTNR